MIFDRNLYYKYIKILENITILAFMIYCFIFMMIGAKYLEVKGIIGFLVGFITGYITYLRVKIKVEEMKWKLDIYNKMTEEKIKMDI